MHKEKVLESRRISVFSPVIFLTIVCLSAMGAMIGIQIIVTLGISANTSVIGAVLAIMMSRLPLASLSLFRNLEAQNLVQTAISSATFSAANGLLVSIGIPWVLNMPELIWPLLAGASVAIIIDGTMLYGLFNTKAYPATNPWPAGVATAETLWAGDQGGKKMISLLAGFATGLGGAFFGIPVASAGIALIGGFFALFMFAIGLLVRGFSEQGLIPYDLMAHYVPHGFMLGAGLIALIQVAFIILKSKDPSDEEKTNAELKESAYKIKNTLARGVFLYFCAAMLLTFLSQIFTTMSLPMLIGFLLFATCAALVQEMVVGMAAMHSGWFPATAAALISLIIGILIGFPPEALAVLTGFCVATGPSFADLGFDLKTGFMIRGYGKDPAKEKVGRKQQYFAAVIGFCVAILVVSFTYDIYFSQDKIVPASRLYAATIAAGSSADIASNLAFWAMFGALLQLVGGSKNQLGILFSTGLMIYYPIAGWTVLVTLALRFIATRFFNVQLHQSSSFAGGLIAGDALFSAGKVFFPLLKTKLVSWFL